MDKAKRTAETQTLSSPTTGSAASVERIKERYVSNYELCLSVLIARSIIITLCNFLMI